MVNTKKKKKEGGEKNIFFFPTKFHSFSLFSFFDVFFSMEKTHKSGNGGEERVYKRKKETLK